MNRREYIRNMALATLGLSSSWNRDSDHIGLFADEMSKTANPPALTPAEVITEHVATCNPRLGNGIPRDFSRNFGATHAGGKYALTQEPFLIEGGKKLQEFGCSVIKLWFGTYAGCYPFHSDWSDLSPKSRLIDIAKHPYYEAVFDLPFSTIILEVTHLKQARHFDAPGNDYSEYEEQLKELTAYLYARYADRPVTFILQNWEGDWLFWKKFVDHWDEKMLADLPRRVDCFIRWFNIRQRGVEIGRNEALAGATPRCQVVHAVEVNRVLALREGEPTLTQLVLPHIAPDLVSWSCYDGLKSPVDTWHGIELIRHYMKTSGYLPKKTVMIGEVGWPEQGATEEYITNFWNNTLAVFAAQEVAPIIHWELYCNEPTAQVKARKPPLDEQLPAEDLRGMWLYRPDGSIGYAARFIQELL